MTDLVPTEDGFEVMEQTDSSTLAVLQSAEIDQQIATARAYPRSIKSFRQQALELATLDEATAMECMYSLPRGGKKITGPSVRLAEIIASTWGNCRYAARIVEEQKDFIVAQGVFHDLEKNSFVSFEVKRRIVDKRGRRFNADMIGVTGNAASSIALRNAVFKGVPKALWANIYNAAVATAVGTEKTLSTRRSMALEWFEKAGATREAIFATLEVADESEITLDHLTWLTGLRSAIKAGDASIDKAFSEPATESRAALNLATGETVDVSTGEVLDGDAIPTEEAEAAPPAKDEKPAKQVEEAPAETSAADEPYANKDEVFAAMNAAETLDELDEVMAAANSCKSWIDVKGRKTSINLKYDDLRKAF